MVRINETADEHIKELIEFKISLFDPVFYESWDGKPFYIDKQ